jgi:hypothetical protein
MYEKSASKMKMKFIVPLNYEKISYVFQAILKSQIKNSSAQNYITQEVQHLQ